ncbi:hypothetical protein SAMN05216308_11653 [Nitrosospira sp. Nsp13]|nr:hypothetical protein SAMN05216308_11653 [Nitrosospira sp. Nsp13]
MLQIINLTHSSLMFFNTATRTTVFNYSYVVVTLVSDSTGVVHTHV